MRLLLLGMLASSLAIVLVPYPEIEPAPPPPQQWHLLDTTQLCGGSLDIEFEGAEDQYMDGVDVVIHVDDRELRSWNDGGVTAWQRDDGTLVGFVRLPKGSPYPGIPFYGKFFSPKYFLETLDPRLKGPPRNKYHNYNLPEGINLDSQGFWNMEIHVPTEEAQYSLLIFSWLSRLKGDLIKNSDGSFSPSDSWDPPTNQINVRWPMLAYTNGYIINVTFEGVS